MTVRWIRQRFESLVGSAANPATEAPDNDVSALSVKHPDGRPLSPNTMRLRLHSYAERGAWLAEQQAEAAERARQEAERRLRRVAELDDLQLQREFVRLARTGR